MENSVLLVRIYLPKIPQFSPREEKKINSVITLIHYYTFLSSYLSHTHPLTPLFLYYMFLNPCSTL